MLEKTLTRNNRECTRSECPANRRPAAGSAIRVRPHFVRLELDARRHWQELINSLVHDQNREDFPLSLRGPWSKLKVYAALLPESRTAGAAEEDLQGLASAPGRRRILSPLPRSAPGLTPGAKRDVQER